MDKKIKAVGGIHVKSPEKPNKFSSAQNDKDKDGLFDKILRTLGWKEEEESEDSANG